MFRNTFTLLTITISTFLLGMAPASAQLKIGTLNMSDVFNAYYKTKAAQAELSKTRDSSKKEMEDRMATLTQAINTIDKLNQEVEKPELSKEAKLVKTKERDHKINEARNLDREVSEFRTMKERQLQEQFGRIRTDIIRDIMTVVGEKVKSAGYDFVLDKSGLSLGQVPVVLYSRDDVDFSSDVITALNQRAPKIKPSNP